MGKGSRKSTAGAEAGGGRRARLLEQRAQGEHREIEKSGDTKVTAGHIGEFDLRPKNNGQQLGVLIS